MDFYLAAWPFASARGGHRRTPFDLVTIARDHGFAGIEIGNRHLADLLEPGRERLRRALEDRHCAAILDIDCDLTAADAATRRRETDRVISLLDMAGAIGARLARITLGGQELSIQRLGRRAAGTDVARPPTTAVEPGRPSRRRSLLRHPVVLHLAHRLRRALPARIADLEGKTARAIDALGPIAHAAADRGLVVAIENHWGISSFPGTIAWIIETVASPNLGACIDFGNFPRNVPTLDGVRRLLPLASIVQVKTLALDRHGEERIIDVRGCCALVAEAGYQGPVTIEYGGLGDPLAGSLATLRLAQRFLADTLPARPA